MSRFRIAVRLSIAIATLGVIAVQGSATAAEDQIAYESGADIWVMNADGTGDTNITNSPGWQEYDPVFSPDGSRIAFTSNKPSPGNPDENYEIFVMNDDGTNQVQQTFVPFSFQFVQSSEPTWSPDGAAIAFTAYREDAGAPQIHKTPADGSGAEVCLTDRTDFASKGQPDWSPDGTTIMFTWDLGQQDVHVMSAVDGSGETNLTPDTLDTDQRSGVWSPDGSRFAFVDNRFFNHLTFNTDIFVRQADGSGEVQVTDHENIDDDPSWSPDGLQITFSSTREGSYDIYSIAVPPPPPAADSPLRFSEANRTAEGPVVRLTNAAGDQTDPDWAGGSGGGGPFLLEVRRIGSGRGLVTSRPAGIVCGRDCSHSYPAGSWVALKARAAQGSTFTGWSGSCSGSGLCVVRMNADKNVSASFSRQSSLD